MRFFGVIVFCVVFYVLYLTSNARHTGSTDFYSKTKEALDRDRGSHHPHAPNKGIAIDNDDEAVALDLANRLKEAEQAAKDNANVKSPKPLGMDAMADKTEEVLEKDESTKGYDVEREMNRLLKRSPSKSIAARDISS
jgi:hypothetical protein